MLVSSIAFLALGLSFESIEEREIAGPDGPLTLVTLGSASYWRVGNEELLSPALDEQDVYVEGKFRSTSSRQGRFFFYMLNSEAEFFYTDPRLVEGVMRGDNVWVGGRAHLYRNEHTRRSTCYVQVSLLMELPEDKPLFEYRFKKYDAKEDWKKMLGLAEWVEKTSKLTERGGFEEFESYQKMARRARSRAYSLRAEILDAQTPGPGLAKEYYDLAMIFYDVLKVRREAEKLLLKAVSLDPGYEKAVRKLEEFGYVKFRGRYVPKAEKRRIEEEEKRRTQVASAQTERRPTGHEIASLVERAMLMEEIAAAARMGTSGLEKQIETLATYSDPPVGKAVVFYVANLPDPAGLKGLAAAAESPAPAVRSLVVQMLRRRGTGGAIDALAGIAGADAERAVRFEALSAIASLKSKGCIEALVDLADAQDEELKAAALDHLRDLTGREFRTHAEWQKWWRSSKLGFVVP